MSGHLPKRNNCSLIRLAGTNTRNSTYLPVTATRTFASLSSFNHFFGLAISGTPYAKMFALYGTEKPHSIFQG